MTDILIVEDDASINDLMKMTLSLEGYRCDQAFTGIEGINMAGKRKYDLILLDVNLPDLDGFSLYRHIDGISVIFVTARDEIEDRLRGFRCGAEDYIVKPFDLQELIARVNVALRRNSSHEEIVRFADLSIDLGRCEVRLGKEKIKLSNQEFALLKTLIEHKNQTLSRRQLLDLAWDMDYEGELRTVDVHIRRLREKLRLDEQIVTVYKTGYRLEM